MKAPQTAFPLDSTPSNVAGKVEGAEMSSKGFLGMLDATCAKLMERQKLKGWRPIEEAPKDDLEIMAFSDGHYAFVFWDKNMELWCNSWGGGLFYPTHFQPLPEPPTL